MDADCRFPTNVAFYVVLDHPGACDRDRVVLHGRLCRELTKGGGRQHGGN